VKGMGCATFRAGIRAFLCFLFEESFMNGFLDVATMEKIFGFLLDKFPEENRDQIVKHIELLDDDTRQEVGAFLEGKLAKKREIFEKIPKRRIDN
jgi:hypothetical protein